MWPRYSTRPQAPPHPLGGALCRPWLACSERASVTVAAHARVRDRQAESNLGHAPYAPYDPPSNVGLRPLHWAGCSVVRRYGLRSTPPNAAPRPIAGSAIRDTHGVCNLAAIVSDTVVAIRDTHGVCNLAAAIVSDTVVAIRDTVGRRRQGGHPCRQAAFWPPAPENDVTSPLSPPPPPLRLLSLSPPSPPLA